MPTAPCGATTHGGTVAVADADAPPAADHFGDLMGTTTSAATKAAMAAGAAFSPLERITLSANGNLQRIISAFYDRAVSVRILQNERVPAAEDTLAADCGARGSPAGATRPGGAAATAHVFRRQVELWCGGERFCVATSRVVVSAPALREALASGRVGIGQLFRHFDMLPRFELLRSGRGRNDPSAALAWPVEQGAQPPMPTPPPPPPPSPAGDAGKDVGGGGGGPAGSCFWRLYLLRGHGVECLIHEQFCEALFSLPLVAVAPE